MATTMSTSRPRFLRVLACIVASGFASVLTQPLRAQCATQWVPGDGVPGVSNGVYAMTSWDPDGPGPAPPVVVVGGAFLVAGTRLANWIAAYDPSTGSWSTLGSGMDGPVYALATLANGSLGAGGSFTTADGVAANNIASWNGTSWSALGLGTGQDVRALTTLPNGDLVAGGTFTTAGGVAANGIARWNGSSWSALGSGLGMPPIGTSTVTSL